jgi:type I restriction enzyme, S subunit
MPKSGAVVEGWKVSDLDELVQLDLESVSAQTPREFSFYYLDIGSTSEGKITLPPGETIFREAPSRARKVVHRHDVLMSTVRPNLKAFAYFDHAHGAFIASTGFAVLTAREATDSRFVLYAILSDSTSRQIETLVSGSNYPAINSGGVPRLKILTPPKFEQAKIAEILSNIDRAIEQTEALIAKQQRIKTGLTHDLLTRGIDEHGNRRSEQTHAFKDSPLGRIPVEWEVKRFGSLLEKINHGWSPDCESHSADVGEWGVLKTTAVVWQGYQEHENKALPSALKPRPSLEIRSGDLLMTRAGPNSRVGVMSYVYETRGKLMLSDKLYRLVPAKNIDGRFLCYSLSGFESQRYLSKLKTGMAESQTNISQDIVKALLTVCPNEKEQAQIADRIDGFSGEANKTLVALKKLRSLKTGLMQDLLTGKKRVMPLLELKPKREKIYAEL